MLRSWADPQLFGFEEVTLIYCTGHGLEQCLPEPLAVKETAVLSGGNISRAGVQRHWAHQVFHQNVPLQQLGCNLSTAEVIFTKLKLLKDQIAVN